MSEWRKTIQYVSKLLLWFITMKFNHCHMICIIDCKCVCYEYGEPVCCLAHVNNNKTATTVIRTLEKCVWIFWNVCGFDAIYVLPKCNNWVSFMLRAQVRADSEIIIAKLLSSIKLSSKWNLFTMLCKCIWFTVRVLIQKKWTNGWWAETFKLRRKNVRDRG